MHLTRRFVHQFRSHRALHHVLKMPTNPLPAAPAAQSPLARYRLLSPTASVRVSPLCLGGMNFGDAWKDYSEFYEPQPKPQYLLTRLVGECGEKSTEEILDYFFEQGGNFIDTSNNYQFEESEKRIGAWMKKRNVRDQMVIATKYTTNYQAVDGQPPKQKILVNFNGNGSKSLHTSIEASLQKLQTSYIDLVCISISQFLALVFTSNPMLTLSLP